MLHFHDEEMQQKLLQEDSNEYRFAFLWESGTSAMFFFGQKLLTNHSEPFDRNRCDIYVGFTAIIAWILLFFFFGLGSFFIQRWERLLKDNATTCFLLYHYPKILICCITFVFVIIDSQRGPHKFSSFASFLCLFSFYVYIFILETIFMIVSRISFVLGAPMYLMGALSLLMCCFFQGNRECLMQDVLLLTSAFAFVGLFYYWRKTVLYCFCLKENHERFVSQVNEVLGNRVLEQTKSKSLVFGQLAHDIGTPLSAMSMAFELLEEQMIRGRVREASNWLQSKEQLEEQEEVFEVIHAAVTAITVLRQSMLDYVRKANDVFLSPALEPVNVQRVVLKKAFILLRQLVKPKKSITASCFVDPQLLTVWLLSSESWLLDMLMNFISNAVKFTEKGEISLCARITQQSEEDQETSCVIFEVVDSGKGVPSDDGDLIFSPFGQLQEDKGGTGLGLVAVRQKARVLGGDAGYRNNVGKPGATFYFTIPFNTVEHNEPIAFNVQSSRVKTGYFESRPCTDSPPPKGKPSGPNPCKVQPVANKIRSSESGAFTDIRTSTEESKHPRSGFGLLETSSYSIVKRSLSHLDNPSFPEDKNDSSPAFTPKRAYSFKCSPRTSTPHIGSSFLRSLNVEHKEVVSFRAPFPARTSLDSHQRRGIRKSTEKIKHRPSDYCILKSPSFRKCSRASSLLDTPPCSKFQGIPGKDGNERKRSCAVFPVQPAGALQTVEVSNSCDLSQKQPALQCELLDVIPFRRFRQRQLSSVQSATKKEEEVTVMVVDDTPILVTLYTRLLKKNDINHIIQARSGEECLKKLFTEGRTVADIILMDDRMSGIRGPAAAIEIHSKCQREHMQCPVIYICTGSCPIQLRDDFPDIDRFVRAILQKPVNKETIRKVVQNEITATAGNSCSRDVSVSERGSRSNLSIDRLFATERDRSMSKRVFDLDVQTMREIRWNVERTRVEKDSSIRSIS